MSSTIEADVYDLYTVIENIYNYGNITVQYNINNVTYISHNEIIFYVQDKILHIKVVNEYCGEHEEYDIPYDEYQEYVKYLVAPLLLNNSKITFNEDKCNKDDNIYAVNELYQRLLPLLTLKRERIERFSKYFERYNELLDAIGNSSNINLNSKDYPILDIHEIKKDLFEKESVFMAVLFEAIELSKIAHKNNEKKYYDDYYDFLNSVSHLENHIDDFIQATNLSYENYIKYTTVNENRNCNTDNLKERQNKKLIKQKKEPLSS